MRVPRLNTYITKWFKSLYDSGDNIDLFVIHFDQYETQIYFRYLCLKRKLQKLLYISHETGVFYLKSS